MLQEAIDLQQNAVAELVRKIKNKNELTFRAPTGSGKTRMMADFMNRMLSSYPDIIFLVSSLSKGNLAEQNYNVFKACADKNIFPNINPYLINSESGNEERLFIPEGYNVYVLPRDLYKDKSKLKDGGALINFLDTMTVAEFERLQKHAVWLIKDECHQATNNLDDISRHYFEKVINFSATPKLSRKQIPDVEITDDDAVNAKLIKVIEWDDESDIPLNEQGKNPEIAIRKFEEIRENYINLLGVNPCLIIQISNKDKAEQEWANIKSILAKTEHQHLKWMSIVDKKEKCETNDKVGKLNVERWKDYAKNGASTIDIIIFKMVISEGWDIPRACMLYQVRDTKSKQLDEQVMGRVRRNPRLVDFETLSSEAQNLALTAWIWGIKPNDGKKTRSVRLYGSAEDIPLAIKIKTTYLKPLTQRQDFDVEKLIGEKSKHDEIAPASIFKLYEKLQRSENEVANICYQYAADDIRKWWHCCEHIDAVQKEYNDYICDYTESMALNKTEVSFPMTSIYVDNEHYQNISDWVWKRKDESDKFSFDSEAEREWASILKDISHENLPEIGGSYLWGKNFLTNSEIKFEYYQNGIHASYPDFVMKDKLGRIHLFEVKSVNVSNKAQFDSEEYKKKILELKKCYKRCSELTDYIYYLPVLRDDVWKITCIKGGCEEQISKEQFKNSLK